MSATQEPMYPDQSDFHYGLPLLGPPSPKQKFLPRRCRGAAGGRDHPATSRHGPRAALLRRTDRRQVGD
ncbi:unnamed protein product [Boreogadus saida]